MPSGSPRTATSRSPAGPSRACGSTDVDGHAADRAAGDRRALADRRSLARRPNRAAGQQPRDHPHRGPGHPARLRQRALGPAQHHRARPGAGADRLRARRRLSRQRHAADPDGQLSRPARAGAAASSARSRPTCAMAVHRRVHGRHPAPHPAPPARRLAADRESRHPQRGRARGRPRGFQPVRAQPLPRLRPLGGRRRASPMASTGRSTCPASRSAPISARATGSTASPRSCRRAPAFPAASPTSSAAPTLAYRPLRQPHPPLPHRQGQPRAPPQRDRRRRSAAGRPMPRSAICGSTATSTRRSRICATARRSASAAASSFARYWSIFGSTVIDLTEPQRGSAVAGRRLRAGPPPARHPLRRRLHRAWRDLAARL